MPKTKEEVEALKADWLSDPIWDIETTEGFEDHKEDLLNYRKSVEVNRLLKDYAKKMDQILDMEAEYPQLARAKKEVEEIKKKIKEYNIEVSGFGYEVVTSTRATWDGKLLDGYAVAHPEILQCKSDTVIVTIRRKRNGRSLQA